MATIKRALTRVVNGHSRSSSKSSSISDDHSLPTSRISNGSSEKDPKEHKEHKRFSWMEPLTAAQKQQAEEAKNKELRPHKSLSDSRKQSFTELKEERRMEREAKDLEDARIRKERMKKAHDEVRIVSRPIGSRPAKRAYRTPCATTGAMFP